MPNSTDIAEALFHDLESFFLVESGFKVFREYCTNSASHAAYTYTADGAKIRFSPEFSDYKVNTLEDFLFVSLIISHELAHYLNLHNKHQDTELLDSVSIEARADNYGALVLMVILTFGTHTHSLLTESAIELNQRTFMDTVPTVLSKLKDFYSAYPSNKYPNASERVMIIICGFLSFFKRYHGEINEIFFTDFLVKIMTSEHFDENIASDIDHSRHDNIQDRLYEIHANIHQNNNILESIKPIFGYFLSANFELSKEERNARMQQLEAEISSFGIMS